MVAAGLPGQEWLLSLLDDERLPVAGMAAVYGMRSNPDRCVTVLCHIAREPGLLGFRAAAALERWKAGDWDLP
jgi:hypothetical protein